jgi:hypothetical protein
MEMSDGGARSCRLDRRFSDLTRGHWNGWMLVSRIASARHGACDDGLPIHRTTPMQAGRSQPRPVSFAVCQIYFD